MKKIILMGAISSWLVACSVDRNEGAELKNNAIPKDPSSKILRVVDAEKEFPVFVTGNGAEKKGYRLECDDDIFGLTNLIAGVGFPQNFYGSLPRYRVDDAKVIDSKYEEQPTLSCKTAATAKLMKTTVNGTDKYYVYFDKHVQNGKQVLNTIGCNGLLIAMGFKLTDAKPIPDDIADLFANRDDAFDINCMSGDPAGSGPVKPKIDPTPATQNVQKGKEITPVSLKIINGGTAAYTFLISDSNCDFLGLKNGNIEGKIPLLFPENSCNLGIVAFSSDGAVDPYRLVINLEAPSFDQEVTVEGPREQTLYPGQSLKPIQVKVANEQIGNYTLAKLSGDCDWLTHKSAEKTIIGLVPNQIATATSCKGQFVVLDPNLKSIGKVIEVKVNVKNIEIKDIGSGDYHTCAIIGDGDVACWGKNDFGQLGYPADQASRGSPRFVQNLPGKAKYVTGGSWHTCALLESGEVACWGQGSSGQLGHGKNTDESSPVLVSGIKNAVGLALGQDHSCAVLADGKVSCWGVSKYGEIGTGVSSGTPINTAQQVQGLPPVAALAAGGDHNCAATSGNGEVYCWGYGLYGQLGNTKSGTDYMETLPVRVVGPTGAGSVLQNVVSLTAGTFQTCAKRADNQVYCWGRGDYGQLGNGQSGAAAKYTATPVLAALSDVASFGTSGGAGHCAALNSGRLSCWGYSPKNLVGDGIAEAGHFLSTPRLADGIVNAKKVTSGENYSCALIDAKTIQCWGEGDQGQLGTGDFAIGFVAKSPVQVKF